MNRTLIVFSYDFPPFDGGIARLCWAIAKGMNAHYCEVKIVTTKKDSLRQSYSLAGLDIHELPAKRGFAEIAAVKYLSKLPSKNEIDILCSQWHPEAALALLCGFKNVFALAHGTELLAGYSLFRSSFWLRFYAKVVLRKCKLVIANSGYTKRIALNVSPKANVVALPLAVDEHIFKPVDKGMASNAFKICTVSRIEKFKGHDLIAKVIANLPSDIRNNIVWEVAGKGPDLEYVQSIVNKLKISNQVIFKGFVADAELPAFYAQQDIFILCSRESKETITVEGFGLVFLEAQSCGVPVIGTRTGGIPDAIKNEDGGWLIEQDDEAHLRTLLVDLFENRNVVVEQAIKARERVLKEATWGIYNKNLKSLIDQHVV